MYLVCVREKELEREKNWKERKRKRERREDSKRKDKLKEIERLCEKEIVRKGERERSSSVCACKCLYESVYTERERSSDFY